MKVLIINQSDLDGGAARATYRIASDLVHQGVNVEMLVMRKLGTDQWVLGPHSFFKYLVSRIFPRVDWLVQIFFGVKKGFSWSINLFPTGLIDEGFVNSFDFVHINWIGKNFIPIRWITKINKPIVWTLHDSWAFTGGCHVPFSCERFKDSCGKCPQLNSSYEKDISYFGLQERLLAYKKLNIKFVAPSNWMAQQSIASSALSNVDVTVIPNGLDTRLFKPHSRITSRKHFSLPNDEFIILFGAMNAQKDSNKGLNLLLQSLELLTEKNLALRKSCSLLIFGFDKNDLPKNSPIRIRTMGIIKDDIELSRIYSSADITVVPSKSESFGQVALESLSCGVPVVCFATTGLLDIVKHLETGYLARPFDPEDLAAGISMIIRDPELLKKMSKQSRASAIERFDINVISKQYANFYKSIKCS
jgi:glycosyltransferase involved in cell wall biosynthesis